MGQKEKRAGPLCDHRSGRVAFQIDPGTVPARWLSIRPLFIRRCLAGGWAMMKALGWACHEIG